METFAFMTYDKQTFMVQIIHGRYQLYSIVWILGTKAQASMFSWTVSTTNERIKPKLEYNGPVLSYEESKEDVIVRNGAFECFKPMLSMYRKDQKSPAEVSLKFKIKKHSY